MKDYAYRKSSIKRPGRFFNFQNFRRRLLEGGVNKKEAFIKKSQCDIFLFFLNFFYNEKITIINQTVLNEQLSKRKEKFKTL